jgi:hypothetical protein
MRWELVLSTLILIGGAAAEARADMIGAPNFTAEETQTIARNELLRDIVQADPLLVRRMLDMMSRPGADFARAPAPAAVGLDPAADPDLAISPRDAQGMVEWNSLIKRAKAEKDQKGKGQDPNLTRSSEGTVEMLDMMRQAKARKGNNGLP